jgi:hypothetical protein
MHRRGLPWVLAATLAAAPHPLHAQGVPPSRLAPFDAGQVEAARGGAMRRLRSPECQRVLTDFADGLGRPLSERLSTFGVPPDVYLSRLAFLDGSRHPRCASGQALLLSTPGLTRVLVCKSFQETIRNRRGDAEAHVIHEMLHTLGLGENPPTSDEITSQVLRRCAP